MRRQGFGSRDEIGAVCDIVLLTRKSHAPTPVTTLLSNTLLRHRGAVSSLFDQALVSLANFVTVFLLARDLDPTHFGLVALVLTGAQILMALQNALVGDVHNVLGPGREGVSRHYLTGSLTAVLIAMAGGIALVCLVTAAALHVLIPESEWAHLPLAMALITVPWMIQDGIRRMLYTERRYPGIFATDAACYVPMVAGAVLMTTGGLPMTYGAAIAVISTSAGLGALVAVGALRVAGAALSKDALRRDLAETWHMARFLLSGEVVRAIQGNVTTWIVAGVAGLPALGAYRAAVHLVNALNPLQQAVSMYWPTMASSAWTRSSSAAYRAWYGLQATRLLLVFALLVTAISVFANPLLELAYGSRYSAYPMGTLVTLSAAGRLFVMGRCAAHIGLVAARQPKIVAVDSVLEAALLALLGLPLILAYGTVGAALFHALAPLVLGVYASTWFVRIGGGAVDPGLALSR